MRERRGLHPICGEREKGERGERENVLISSTIVRTQVVNERVCVIEGVCERRHREHPYLRILRVRSVHIRVLSKRKGRPPAGG